MSYEINGNTLLYGLIGKPLYNAKSPKLLNRLFAEMEANAVCIPLEVDHKDLSYFIGGLRSVRNLSGLLVTMPHKQTMLEMVDILHPTAQQVGATNVIRCHNDGRWEGAVFDGLGCVLGIQRQGINLVNKAALLIGAGGSGRAIAFALAASGIRTLVISDVDPHRAADLALCVGREGHCMPGIGSADPAGYDLVINATPLGMHASDPLPIDAGRLEPKTFVVDIVTRAEPTALLAEARSQGCQTQNGEPMHLYQALLALSFLGFDEIERRYLHQI